MISLLKTCFGILLIQENIKKLKCYDPSGRDDDIARPSKGNSCGTKTENVTFRSVINIPFVVKRLCKNGQNKSII